MNFSFLLGIITAFAVFFGGLESSSNNANIFYNVHALLIVIGGTIAASLISFPLGHQWKILGVVIKSLFRGQGPNPRKLIGDLVELASINREDPEALKGQLTLIQMPFLKEALGLYLDSAVPPEKIESVLRKRAEVNFLQQESDAGVLRSIARFPPAFGLLGAVMGMITLLRSLGAPDSFKQIGPAMAMAMVATMYGIAIANFILLPISAYLSKMAQEEFLRRSLIIDALKLIQTGEHPLVVEENLKSYLQLGETVIKKVSAA